MHGYASPAGGHKLKVGFAFVAEFDPKNHLHFIASDARQPELVVLNFTDAKKRWADTACVFDVGDHPWIEKPSAISWWHARCMTPDEIQQGLRSSGLVAHDVVSDEVMVRVWERAQATRNLDVRLVKILRDQGLIQ
jgi:hypothetical protein